MTLKARRLVCRVRLECPRSIARTEHWWGGACGRLADRWPLWGARWVPWPDQCSRHCVCAVQTTEWCAGGENSGVAGGYACARQHYSMGGETAVPPGVGSQRGAGWLHPSAGALGWCVGMCTSCCVCVRGKGPRGLSADLDTAVCQVRRSTRHVRALHAAPLVRGGLGHSRVLEAKDIVVVVCGARAATLACTVVCKQSSRSKHDKARHIATLSAA
jgi:hypothetical protein